MAVRNDIPAAVNVDLTFPAAVKNPDLSDSWVAPGAPVPAVSMPDPGVAKVPPSAEQVVVPVPPAPVQPQRDTGVARSEQPIDFRVLDATDFGHPSDEMFMQPLDAVPSQGSTSAASVITYPAPEGEKKTPYTVGFNSLLASGDIRILDGVTRQSILDRGLDPDNVSLFHTSSGLRLVPAVEGATKLQFNDQGQAFYTAGQARKPESMNAQLWAPILVAGLNSLAQIYITNRATKAQLQMQREMLDAQFEIAGQQEESRAEADRAGAEAIRRSRAAQRARSEARGTKG